MTLFNDFLSLIYPRQCEACGGTLLEQEKYICLQCLVDLPKSKNTIKHGNEILNVLLGRVPLQSANYLYSFEKSGPVQNLLHAIKYQNQKELATFLGEQMAFELKDQIALQNIDYLIPIPLHQKKLKSRGYNQSEFFAKGISNQIQKPILSQNLKRTVETSTQTKKRKYQRWENVKGIFELQQPEQLINKHILLVDDVVTTGATIEAAWEALKEVEGINVSVASIAFAQKN